MPNDIENILAGSGIIAVLVIDDSNDAVRVAKTLLDNGIGAIELTLRTDSAMDSLKRILNTVPEMIAGIGTILRPDQVDAVKNAGAAFGVAPGFNPDIVDCSRTKRLPFGPGIATPSEIEGAVSHGCRVLKYFHAEGMGGIKYLKGINAPYEFLKLKYIPLGGLNTENIRGYLEMPEVLALGGSWIAPRKLIQEKDWSTIGRNAAVAARIFRDVRG